MVRYDDDSLAFRHELARRALEDSLTHPRQQSLHSKVLAVLAQRPGIPAARLAHHADGARNAEQVLRFAPIAASQAASVGAHSEAVSHYQAALRYASRLTSEENGAAAGAPVVRVLPDRPASARHRSATLRAGNLARLGRAHAGRRYATVAVPAGLVCGQPRGSAAVRRRGHYDARVVTSVPRVGDGL